MSEDDFLDTNVLVYAYDATAPEKRRIAQDLIRKSIAGHGIISIQVLGELATTLLHKISPRASAEQVGAILDALAPIKVVATDSDSVRRAVEACGQYGIHLYDGMIIAAAERAGCKRIWSEDLNSGQSYFGVRVENPFGAAALKAPSRKI
jgi:predicted nucleic acid-binding protein